MMDLPLHNAVAITWASAIFYRMDSSPTTDSPFSYASMSHIWGKEDCEDESLGVWRTRHLSSRHLTRIPHIDSIRRYASRLPVYISEAEKLRQVLERIKNLERMQQHTAVSTEDGRSNLTAGIPPEVSNKHREDDQCTQHRIETGSGIFSNRELMEMRMERLRLNQRWLRPLDPLKRPSSISFLPHPE